MDGVRGNLVRILDNLFGSHLDHLQKGMGLATRRQALLTNNLANVNTPGYKRQDIDFNVQLDEATERFSKLGSSSRNSGSIRIDGNNVDLEQEIVAIAETELRYSALADMTAGYFAGLKNVIREGK